MKKKEEDQRDLSKLSILSIKELKEIATTSSELQQKELAIEEIVNRNKKVKIYDKFLITRIYNPHVGIDPIIRKTVVQGVFNCGFLQRISGENRDGKLDPHWLVRREASKRLKLLRTHKK